MVIFHSYVSHYQRVIYLVKLVPGVYVCFTGFWWFIRHPGRLGWLENPPWRGWFWQSELFFMIHLTMKNRDLTRTNEHHIHTYIYTDTQYIYIYIYTYIHTYIHTYIYIHIYIMYNMFHLPILSQLPCFKSLHLHRPSRNRRRRRRCEPKGGPPSSRRRSCWHMGCCRWSTLGWDNEQVSLWLYWLILGYDQTLC